MSALMEGIIHGLDEHVYHSHAALSSTGARRILDSPAKFRYWQTHPEPQKDAYDLGTAVHTKVLGVGREVITYPPEHLTPSGNASTKAATVEWLTEQRDNGLVVISAAQARQVDAMAEAALAYPEARAILENVAGREVSIFTDVDGVPTRARFDIYEGNTGADVKTAVDASPDGFNRAVKTYGLHIQEAWYGGAHRAETGTDLDSFKFIVAEKAAPYLVGVYDLDIMWRDIGREKAQKARETWLRCTETGEWPGYTSGTLSCPTYVVFDHETQEIEV